MSAPADGQLWATEGESMTSSANIPEITPELLAAALTIVAAAGGVEDPAPAEPVEVDPAPLADPPAAVHKLYRTNFTFIEFDPGRQPKHAWRARDPRPYIGNARPDLGLYATEGEALSAVLCEIACMPDPWGTLLEWLGNCERKRAKNAADPAGSAYRFAYADESRAER